MKHNENWQKMYLKYKSLPNLSSLVFFFECQTQCFSALVLGTNENYDDDFGNFDDNDGQKNIQISRLLNQNLQILGAFRDYKA